MIDVQRGVVVCSRLRKGRGRRRGDAQRPVEDVSRMQGSGWGLPAGRVQQTRWRGKCCATMLTRSYNVVQEAQQPQGAHQPKLAQWAQQTKTNEHHPPGCGWTADTSCHLSWMRTLRLSGWTVISLYTRHCRESCPAGGTGVSGGRKRAADAGAGASAGVCRPSPRRHHTGCRAVKLQPGTAGPSLNSN